MRAYSQHVASWLVGYLGVSVDVLGWRAGGSSLQLLLVGEFVV